MSRTTAHQDRLFAEAIGKAQKLEDLLEGIDFSPILDLVSSEFNPEDVFTEAQLESWAEANGYVKE